MSPVSSGWTRFFPLLGCCRQSFGSQDLRAHPGEAALGLVPSAVAAQAGTRDHVPVDVADVDEGEHQFAIVALGVAVPIPPGVHASALAIRSDRVTR